MAIMHWFLLVLGLALPVAVGIEAMTQQKTWQELFKADAIEAFVFFIGSSLLGAAAACLFFSIPAFGFPYLVYGLVPNQVSAAFWETFSFISFGIVIAITGLIASGLAVALNRQTHQA